MKKNAYSWGVRKALGGIWPMVPSLLSQIIRAKETFWISASWPDKNPNVHMDTWSKKTIQLFHWVFNSTWTEASPLIDKEIVEVAIGPPQIRELMSEDIGECGTEHSVGHWEFGHSTDKQVNIFHRLVHGSHCIDDLIHTNMSLQVRPQRNG